MNATIKNGKLVIELAADENPTQPSKSGKTLLVATTHGNLTTTCVVKGRPLVVSVNAYIKL